MKLIIEDDEGRKTVVPVVRDEITIGRQDGNTIKLTERNVSRRHARLWKADGSLLIEDLGSYNGIRVNGDKIEGPTTIREGDLVEIGDYDLGIQGKIEASAPAKAAPPAPKTAPPKTTPVPAPASAPAPINTPPMASAPVPAVAASPMQEMSPTASAGGATAIININQLMGAAPQVEVRDLPKSEMPRLVGLAGAFRGKEFYLMKTEWKIGRTEENDASLDHQSISRQHCKFIFDGTDWKIYDNKSANGVKVNGDLYGVATVKPGDTVELGHVKFRFCAPGEKFTPPPEKVDGQTGTPGGKPPPTTAELIAAASGRGPSAMPAAAPKSNTGMIIGIVVAIVVVAGIAFAMMGKKGGSSDENASPTGDAALKAAHAAADKKDFVKASELAESAGAAAPASFKKKMSDEAQAQAASQRFDAALASNDPDKAKIELDRCASEDTYYCGKVKEREDDFKKSYAKKHLFLAQNAKGTNPALCTEEMGKVLAVEPGNTDAQTLSQQCSPQVAQPVAPRPVVPAGPSQKERDAQALDKYNKGTDEYKAGDPTSAQADLLGCVNLKPSVGVIAKCYRALGVVNGSNKPEAAKWFKKYLPYCVPEECDKVRALIASAGG